MSGNPIHSIDALSDIQGCVEERRKAGRVLNSALLVSTSFFSAQEVTISIDQHNYIRTDNSQDLLVITDTKASQ